MPNHELLFRTFDQDLDTELPTVEGEWPAELRGEFLRIGPGLQQCGPDSLALLDGLGMVASLTVGQGVPRLRARLVDSPSLRKVRAATGQAERFVFTNLPSRIKNFLNAKLANPVSHAVYAWAGKVHATDAFGHMALDPQTLATLGPSDLTGKWRGPPSNTSQMMRYCPKTDRLLTCLVSGVPGKRAKVQVFEIDRAGAVAATSAGLLPAGTGNIHDIAVTPLHTVVFQFGQLGLGSLLWGAKPAFDAIAYDPHRTPHLVVMPRDGGPQRVVPVPGLFFFHMFNAFDREDGSLVVDCCGYPGKPSFAATYPPALLERHGLTLAPQRGPRPTRITVAPDGKVTVEERSTLPTEAPSTHPGWHGKPSRYGWSGTSGTDAGSPDPSAYFFFHGVTKVDFESGTADTWDAGPSRFVSPVQMVPRPGATREDDGWVLAWVLDAARERTDIVVLDAAAPSRGPIATIRDAPALPAVSHVHFVAA